MGEISAPRRYAKKELLQLRGSPLVCKPPGLPAIETWMGTPPEPNQRKPALNRAKTEEPGPQKDLPAARPSFLENRRQSRVSGNVPPDIILGPPKTAFASASAIRSSAKPIESSAGSAFGPLTGGLSRGEIPTPRERLQGEKEKKKDEDEVDRGSRPTYTNGRRGDNDERDWESLRSGRNFGQDDNGHRGFGRFGERNDAEKPDSWAPKRQNQKAFDRWGDDTPGTPRNGDAKNGRSSWYRDQDKRAQEPQEAETGRDVRTRGWRDGEKSNRRGPERDRNARPVREETAPEWMESEPAKKSTADAGKRVHTADDIEKWKASMRASKETSVVPVQAPDLPVSHERSASGNLLNGKNAKIDKPLGMDPAFDSFLGLWSRTDLNTISAKDAQEKSIQEVPQMKPLKPSKFTGFFNPKPLSMPTNPNPETEPPATAPPTVNNSSSEDKEGFQRILQMLGGTNGNAKTNENDINDCTESFPINWLLQQKPSEKQQQNISETRASPPREPIKETPNQRDQESPPIHSPRSRRSLGLENLLSMEPPRDSHTTRDKTSNSDFFLSLLQQPNTKPYEPQQTLPNHHAIANATSNLPFPASMQQQQHHHQVHQPTPQTLQNIRPDFHHADSLPLDFRARDKLNPNHLQTAKRLLDAYDDPAILPTHQRHIQQQPQQQPPHSANLAHLPPGLQRAPPGFDPHPPTYPPHQHQHLPPHHPQHPSQQNLQHPRGAMPAPPPGFPGQPPQQRQNPCQFPPGLLPSLSALNLSSHNANNERVFPFPMRAPQPASGVNSPAHPPLGFGMMQNGGALLHRQGFFPIGGGGGHGMQGESGRMEGGGGGGRMSPTRGMFFGGQGGRPEGYEGRGLPGQEMRMPMGMGMGMPGVGMNMGNGFYRRE